MSLQWMHSRLPDPDWLLKVAPKGAASHTEELMVMVDVESLAGAIH
jgi:hypothetical protein